MSQTQESGARGRDYGYEMARQVALKLEATLTNPGKSNEAIWGERTVLIKSARRNTSQIGATELTLKRVRAIVAALQDTDGGYSLYEVAAEWFRGEMTPSMSRRGSHVMMVKCCKMREAGRLLGRL